MRRILPTALVALAFTSLASADTITAAYFTTDKIGPASTLSIGLFGANFALVFAPVLGALPTPSLGSCTGTTCSFDFSNTGSYTASFLAYSLTYNGNSYGLGSDTNSLRLDLTFTSIVADTPLSEVTTPPPGRVVDTALWTNIPFTVSGSFTVMKGGNVIVTDSIDGSGLAGASFRSTRIANTASVGYFIVPEPATVATVGVGLLMAGWRRRRLRASKRV